jgi:hypothetical protein
VRIDVHLTPSKDQALENEAESMKKPFKTTEYRNDRAVGQGLRGKYLPLFAKIFTIDVLFVCQGKILVLNRFIRGERIGLS